MIVLISVVSAEISVQKTSGTLVQAYLQYETSVKLVWLFPDFLVREVCTELENIMNKARYLEPADRVKAAQLNIEMGDWMHALAPW